MARNRTPEYVPIETVDVGDYASFTFKQGDMWVTNLGCVANISFHGKTRILVTENGQELAHYDISNPNRVKVGMMERYRFVEKGLFDMIEQPGCGETYVETNS